MNAESPEVQQEEIERYEEVIIIEERNEGDVPEEAVPEVEVNHDRIEHDIPVDQEVVIETNEEPQRDECKLP